MRDRLRNPPLRLITAMEGAVFGVIMAVFMSIGQRGDGENFTRDLIIDTAIGAVAWGILGALLGPWYVAIQQAARDAVSELDEPQRAAAKKAAVKGPIPADPQVRQAAERLARQRLERVGWFLRLPGILLIVALVIFWLGFALWSQPWLGLIGALAFGSPVIIACLTTSRLRRRTARLQEEPSRARSTARSSEPS